MDASHSSTSSDKTPVVSSVFHQSGEENLGSEQLQGRKKSNACGRKLTQIKTKISDWAAAHPKTAKALKYTAIALLVLTILGGALLAYMHFSGLGISKAGFVQLGHQISNLANKAWTKFIDAMKAPAHLNIGEVMGIAAGSALGGVLAVAAGVGIKKACDKRKQQNQLSQLDFDEFEQDAVKIPKNISEKNKL